MLVTGVSGSGKSSTVAAMVHHMNRTQHKHVVTIENPIEFLHRDLSCSITQREVGVDTESLAVGLRAALRQDPDVVVIGEMADAETIDTAIKAAETGHLVIATMPTADVVATIERVVATLPAEEREVGRMRFAEALRAVVSQQLLPEKDEKARVPAVEVMVSTPAIRDIIRDGGRTADVLKHMADGRKQAGQPDLSAAPRGAGAERPHLAGQREGRPRAHQAAGAGQARWQARGRRLSRPRWPRSTRSPHTSSPSTGKRVPPKPSMAAISWPATSPRWAIASPVSSSASIPPRCSAFPILGAGVGAAALLALPLLALPGVPGWGALVVWGLVLAATACLAGGVAAGWLTLGEAREDANLVAVRGDAAPSRWIVAHLDTKAQAQSMAGRLVAVWVLLVAVGCGTGLTLVRLGTPLPLWIAASSAALAVVAGALAGRGRLRGRPAGRGTTGAASWPPWRAPRRRMTVRPASSSPARRNSAWSERGCSPKSRGVSTE